MSIVQFVIFSETHAELVLLVKTYFSFNLIKFINKPLQV